MPYIQVTQETWDHARALASLTGVDVGRAFMAVCDLWKWGLSLGPEDQPPTGVLMSPRVARLLAAGISWTGDADVLLEALIDLRLVERLEDGIRVRGTDRYRRTWEKNKRRKPADMVPVTGATSAETGAPDADADAEEKKHTSPDGDHEPEALRALWNEKAAPVLPRCTVLSEKRHVRAKARLRERPLPEWPEVIRRMNASPFCLGSAKWRATFDWILQPDTATKILEGSYDRGQPLGPEPPKGIAPPRKSKPYPDLVRPPPEAP